MTTIVLSNCFTSWCQSEVDTIPSTGELVAQDSVLIAFDDLRKVNSKLIELKYTKQINDSLKQITINDDVIIREYKYNTILLSNQIKKENKKYKIALWGGISLSVSLVLLLLIK